MILYKKKYNTGGILKYQTGGSVLDSISTYYDKVYNTLNYKNWGVEDYSDRGDFNKAYSAAKLAGEKEFFWEGKRYNTKYAGTPRQEAGKYGVDGKPIDKQDLNNPYLLNKYDWFGPNYLPGHLEAQSTGLNNRNTSIDFGPGGNRSKLLSSRRFKEDAPNSESKNKDSVMLDYDAAYKGNASQYNVYMPDKSDARKDVYKELYLLEDKLKTMDFNSQDAKNIREDIKKKRMEGLKLLKTTGRKGFERVSKSSVNTDYNIFTNNCADKVCDAFGLPRETHSYAGWVQTPHSVLEKLSKTYPTQEITNRTLSDYKNLTKTLENKSIENPKEVLSQSDHILGLSYSPDLIDRGLNHDLVLSIQTSLNSQGYNLKEDGIAGDKTMSALKDYKKIEADSTNKTLIKR